MSIFSSSVSSTVSSFYVLHDILPNPHSLNDLYLPLGFCIFSFILKMFFEILCLSSLNTILFTSVLFQLFILKS